MAKMTKRSPMGEFRNQAGEVFELSWSGWTGADADTANYRLYSVTAHHAVWRIMNFSVIIKKSAYGDEAAALLVLTGEALRTIKALLDRTSAEGRDLDLPDLGRDWYVT